MELLTRQCRCNAVCRRRRSVFWTHDEDKLVWRSFGDDLEIFGRYDASPWVTPVLFSAEGDIIVAIGNRPGQQDYGLFILHSDQFES